MLAVNVGAIPNKQGPTNDFLNRQPTTKLAAKRMDRGLRAIKTYKRMASQNQNAVGELHTTALKTAEIAILPVDELTTAKSQNGGFQPKMVVGDLRTYTADHGVLAVFTSRADDARA